MTHEEIHDELVPTGGDPVLLDVSPDGGGDRAANCLILPTAGAIA